ncbi:MAG TPA: hypothetical protein VG076_08030 [Acidimicrobiales bacterium]|jgi:hypothetical protein|nr:hypothetical protein [Acidimicrobiales bacterium]
MRSTVRKLLAGLGILTVAAATSVLVAPAPAHAATCYTIWIGSQATTICPWQ